MSENRLVNKEEVQDILRCSQSVAYRVIRDLNEELNKKGYYTISGKVSLRYLNERFFGVTADESA